MPAGPLQKTRFAAGLRFAVALCLATSIVPARAQDAPPISPAQFDPSEVYLQGFMSCRKAEELEAKGEFIASLEQRERAQKLFETVRRYYPDWMPDMVGTRTTKNQEDIAKLRPKSDAQIMKNRAAVAELEGGVKVPAKVDEHPLIAPPPGVFETDPLMARRLAEAEAEVKRLKAASNVVPDADPSRNASRVHDMALQRDEMQARLRAAENTVESLRSKLAASPVENEVRGLNQRIANLEQERAAMSLALDQSRSSHTDAMAKTAILEADLKVMRQKQADLDRDIKTERSVNSNVIAGLRAQLQSVEKELSNKAADLGKANERIAGLMKELDESHAAFDQLRTERDSLLQERDQMSAMLKLSSDARIQDLIQQNMGLAKNLREAEETVDRLNKENNASKDELLAAQRDLGMTKAQINRLKQERKEQDQRIEALQQRLKGEEEDLASGKSSADPEEVATLRDIIQRQLRVQERRRQAKELLVDAVKDLASKDERVAKAVELFDGEELHLTPAEQKLVANQNVDGEFVSPVARPAGVVSKATEELNRDIAVFERTAEKSFAAGRLLPTRELFEMIVEQHPGHVPTLCKLGVVDLKLNDAMSAADKFRRAVELDGNNPYAHRMLGFSLMSVGDLQGAEQSIKQSAELAPDDAKSHLLLGIICNKQNRLDEAETHYKAAIAADPMQSEAYFNLALLYARTKRLDDARAYYQQALERGAVPDPALEQRFNNH